MKYLDEFRNSSISKYLLSEIRKTVKNDWVIMEMCGGQTHTIIQYGVDRLLPKNIEMVHGPGCPVCVTPLEIIDQAIAISKIPNVIFTSFGDMLRVPGSDSDLLKAKSEGADVRIVYSPLESIRMAKSNPDKEIVFLAIGFETTAPGNAMAIKQAETKSLDNFSALVSHVLVPPAIEGILSSPNIKVKGFLAAGHVCSIMGYWEYEEISKKFNVPIVPTGFEPVDLLHGILALIELLEKGESAVINQYTRAVKREGNIPAQKMIKEVFDITDRKWRGIGTIPKSGLKINDKYRKYDASIKFNVNNIKASESSECISGQILQGLKKPFECPLFINSCTPSSPVGATMVSGEGTCAAYYKYHRFEAVT